MVITKTERTHAQSGVLNYEKYYLAICGDSEEHFVLGSDLVSLQKFTDVSEERTVSIFRVSV
jgi:hypothetical protein